MATYNITVLSSSSSGNGYRFSGTDESGSISSSTNNPTINITTGDTINFTFSNMSNHPFRIAGTTITGNSANGGYYGNNSTYASYTFSSAMTYAYNCTVHGNSMAGSIISSAASTTTTTTTSTTSTSTSTTSTSTTSTTATPTNTTTTTTTDAPDDTITTTTTTTTTTIIPTNDDGDLPVWDGNYKYFIYVFQSGSSMPPGISGGVTRSGSSSFLNRNNFWDNWLPDGLSYVDVELQWQIAGINVSGRQGWEDRGNPETKVFTYDSLKRAQYSNTILPEEYESRSLSVDNTGAGTIFMHKETGVDFDSYDTVSLSLSNQRSGEIIEFTGYYYLSIRLEVNGAYLTYDDVCPPTVTDPDTGETEWEPVYGAASTSYSLVAGYDPKDQSHRQDSVLLALYVPSECNGGEQGTQYLESKLTATTSHNSRRIIGSFEHISPRCCYSHRLKATAESQQNPMMSWIVPEQTEIIYDYTDSEWYMAHAFKPEKTRQRYEIFGDDKYELYGYEFQWISDKPDETGWHQWFKITSDDILPTEGWTDVNGTVHHRDLFTASGPELGSSADLGFIATVIKGRDGVRYPPGTVLHMELDVNDNWAGLGFVAGIDESKTENNGSDTDPMENFYSHFYQYRVRAIYRCNRTTNRSNRVIMPDGTYDSVPIVTILLASSEYYPYKSTDPLPSFEGHGIDYLMDRGGGVRRTTYKGMENFKDYEMDSTLDGTNPEQTIDSVLDPDNQTPTTTTTPEPEFPIE